jgi:hypothetical protein
MTDVIMMPPEAMRILRDIQRSIAGITARLDSQRASIDALRDHMLREFGGVRGEIAALREHVQESLHRQDAILVNNSVLLDEQGERITALELAASERRDP